MFGTLHVLFEDWNRRLESSATTANDVVHEKKTTSSVSSSKLDTNSRNTLNTILYSNLRHRKQEIPRNYEVDEEAGGGIIIHTRFAPRHPLQLCKRGLSRCPVATKPP